MNKYRYSVPKINFIIISRKDVLDSSLFSGEGLVSDIPFWPDL